MELITKGSILDMWGREPPSLYDDAEWEETMMGKAMMSFQGPALLRFTNDLEERPLTSQWPFGEEVCDFRQRRMTEKTLRPVVGPKRCGEWSENLYDFFILSLCRCGRDVENDSFTFNFWSGFHDVEWGTNSPFSRSGQIKYKYMACDNQAELLTEIRAKRSLGWRSPYHFP